MTKRHKIPQPDLVLKAITIAVVTYNGAETLALEVGLGNGQRLGIGLRLSQLAGLVSQGNKALQVLKAQRRNRLAR